jgi:hypothetical protein
MRCTTAITNCGLQIALGFKRCCVPQAVFPDFEVSVLTIATSSKRPSSVAEVLIELSTTRTLYVSRILSMTGTSRRSFHVTPNTLALGIVMTGRDESLWIQRWPATFRSQKDERRPIAVAGDADSE